MCGVIGLAVQESLSVKEIIRERYLLQEQRGTEGYGLGVRYPDGRLERARTQTAKEIFRSPLWERIMPGCLVLFHHRSSTSTPNIPECNHPLMNEKKDIMMIHNGIISRIKTGEGHRYESRLETVYKTASGKTYFSSFEEVTDTEKALHRYEELLKTENPLSALKTLVEEEQGAQTFLVLTKDRPEIFYIASNCLNFIQTPAGPMLASSGCDDLSGTYGVLDFDGIRKAGTISRPFCSYRYYPIYDDYPLGYESWDRKEKINLHLPGFRTYSFVLELDIESSDEMEARLDLMCTLAEDAARLAEKARLVAVEGMDDFPVYEI